MNWYSSSQGSNRHRFSNSQQSINIHYIPNWSRGDCHPGSAATAANHGRVSCTFIESVQRPKPLTQYNTALLKHSLIMNICCSNFPIMYTFGNYKWITYFSTTYIGIRNNCKWYKYTNGQKKGYRIVYHSVYEIHEHSLFGTWQSHTCCYWVGLPTLIQVQRSKNSVGRTEEIAWLARYLLLRVLFM